MVYEECIYRYHSLAGIDYKGGRQDDGFVSS